MGMQCKGHSGSRQAMGWSRRSIEGREQTFLPNKQSDSRHSTMTGWGVAWIVNEGGTLEGTTGWRASEEPQVRHTR